MSGDGRNEEHGESGRDEPGATEEAQASAFPKAEAPRDRERDHDGQQGQRPRERTIAKCVGEMSAQRRARSRLPRMNEVLPGDRPEREERRQACAGAPTRANGFCRVPLDAHHCPPSR